MYDQSVREQRGFAVEKKARLPRWEDLVGRLHRRYDDRHADENLWPLFRHNLYQGAAEKTGQEIGDALIDALREYILRVGSSNRRLQRSEAVIMSSWLNSFLEAIAEVIDDDEVVDDMHLRCDNRRRDLIV